jgi:uncharacterized BrkB/YihY/UPF0761 family membrane protein
MRRSRTVEPAQGMALSEEPPQEKPHEPGKGVITLTVTATASLALVLAVAVFLLCKNAGLKIWHAAVCTIFGFCLASTSFAPYISQLINSLIRHV